MTGLLPSGRPQRAYLHLTTAQLWAQRSLCKRAKVAAIITTKDLKQIRSFGYNGPAAKLPEDRCRNTVGTCGCIHAETNAIANLKTPDGKIMFTTVAPCEMCAQLIVNAGIEIVYVAQEYRDGGLGLELLEQCGVEVCKIQWSLKEAMEFAAKLLS